MYLFGYNNGLFCYIFIIKIIYYVYDEEGFLIDYKSVYYDG